MPVKKFMALMPANNNDNSNRGLSWIAGWLAGCFGSLTWLAGRLVGWFVSPSVGSFEVAAACLVAQLVIITKKNATNKKSN